ncbi:MAG: quinonprotein alcohol dehydrogenase [Planctomycetes bacterium]|nr:quinonprotein alcohol dehydrogenase [Planctomycetota bacterium]
MRNPRSLALVLSMLVSLAPAQDVVRTSAWSDYRGPTWDGQAPGADVPLTWSEKKNIAWKTEIPGVGYSSPVIASGRAWLTTSSPKGRKLSVIAVDLKTGKKVVDRVLFTNDTDQKKNAFNSYASPSPTAEPGRVFIHFGEYGTACLGASSGKTLWSRTDIPHDSKEGPGSSPILYRDLLIFNCDGIDVQYVIALDKKTGKTRWKTNRSIDLRKKPSDMRKAFSTPIIVNVGGLPRLISTAAEGTMAYDPMTGKELWKFRHSGFSNSSRPLFAAGMLLLNTGFMRPRLIAAKAEGRGTVTQSAAIWSYRQSVPTMSSPVIVGKRIYMVSDKGTATCLDLESGKRIWRERLGSSHCSSPIHAAGRIYFFDRDGKTTVIKPGDTFERIAENQLEARFMASAAIDGNAFILRSVKHLYRIDEEH